MANPQIEDGYTKIANEILRNDWKFKRDFEKAKVLVWKRDKGICANCGAKPNRYDVHHIIPISKGGPLFEIDNLQTLCRHCHKNKHQE